MNSVIFLLGRSSHQLSSRRVRSLYGEVYFGECSIYEHRNPHERLDVSRDRSSNIVRLTSTATTARTPVHSTNRMIPAIGHDSKLIKTDENDSREFWTASKRLKPEDTLHKQPDVARFQHFIRPFQLSRYNAYTRVLRPYPRYDCFLSKEKMHTCSRCGQPDAFCTCSRQH